MLLPCDIALLLVYLSFSLNLLTVVIFDVVNNLKLYVKQAIGWPNITSSYSNLNILECMRMRERK